ncbi:MAG: DUF192 domain-containing protein [Proteobacteria bacterium]|nr:MAG: DUF192 domain-containing protein [Pseudomonadota bacterium]
MLFPHCDITANAWERLVGLLPRAGLAEGEALYIEPCTSIHNFFMRFAIDVAFLNRQGRVVAIYHGLKPWRLSWIHFTAKGALEAPAGSLARAGVKKGDVLTICPSS